MTDETLRMRRALLSGSLITFALVGVLAADRLGYVPFWLASSAASLLRPATDLALWRGDVIMFYTPYSSSSSDGFYAPAALLGAPGFWLGLIVTVALYSAIVYGGMRAWGSLISRRS